MTIETTKTHLAAALDDADGKVIALSGRWGSGKSHLWTAVQKASANDAVKNAIYVSLFGVTSMDQVKMKVVQSAVPIAAENPNLFKGVKTTLKGAVKTLEGLHKGFAGLGALGELAILLTPTILKNKVIVLDDIERKHQNLAVDEILGFIDEFTQRHGSRFVLILNTDRLEDKPIWETFREKIIDVELKLETSPEEAFSIAIALTPSQFAPNIKSAVIACALTNIRIVRKVIRSINNILADRKGLSEAVLARVIPSTVLLSAIHYRGIENGPPMEYVIQKGSSKDWEYLEKETKDEESDDAERHGKWKGLLERLGIYICDEYELLIVDYLESGLFETEAISRIIDRYAEEEQSMGARALAGKFLQDSYWEHRLTDAQLRDQAHALAMYTAKMDPRTLSDVCETIEELPNGKAIADSMIQTWTAAFKKNEIDISEYGSRRHQKYHPAIQAELEAKNVQMDASISILDVCKQVSEQRSWGTRHKVVMSNSTASDYEKLIRTLQTSDLQVLLLQMLEFLTHKSGSHDAFDAGADQFAMACRSIVHAPDAGRLGKLIQSLFDGAKLSEHLIQPTITSDIDSSAK
jgi:hypothetical protein